MENLEAGSLQGILRGIGTEHEARRDIRCPRYGVMQFPFAHHHVIDGQAATRPEYAVRLPVEPVAIRYVHRDVLQEHDVESLVRDGEVEGAPELERHAISQAASLGQVGRGLDELRTEVDTDDLAPKR